MHSIQPIPTQSHPLEPLTNNLPLLEHQQGEDEIHKDIHRLKSSPRQIFQSISTIFAGTYGLQAIMSIMSKGRSRSDSFLSSHFGLDKARVSFIFTAVSATFQLLGLVTPSYFSKTSDENSHGWRWSAVKGALASLWLVGVKRENDRRQIALTLAVRIVYFAVRAWIFQFRPASTRKDQKHSVDGNDNGQCDVDSKSLKPHLWSESVSNLARLLDQYGVYMVWLFNAYWICSWSFLSSHLLPPSYFRSVLYLSSCRDRLGPDYENIVIGTGELTRFLSTQPSDSPIAQIPLWSTSKAHIEHLFETVQPTDRHASALMKLHGLRKEFSEGGLGTSGNHSTLSCAVIHPGETICETAALRVFVLGLPKLLKIYSVINTAIFSWSLAQYFHKRVTTGCNHPRDSAYLVVFHSLKRMLISSARSVSAFSIYLLIYSYSICRLRKICGKDYMVLYGLAGLIASPSMLIEKQTRLPELNTYLTMQVIAGFISMAIEAGWFKYKKYAEMAVIVPAMATLGIILEHYPHAPQGIYGPLLHKYFGTHSKHPTSHPKPQSTPFIDTGKRLDPSK
ncbi:hypothetical protein BDV3_004404 [Batrachochytrium dendrobatidis]